MAESAPATFETVKPISYSAQRKSIGEVSKREKAQSKKITRTTVINPRQIEWPDNIDDAALTELKTCIKECVKVLRFPAPKIPLKEIRQVKKEDRRKFREEWRAKHAAESAFDVQNYGQIRSNLALGVNCVSRALDLNELAGVIIEKDVSPSIITKLLVPSALAKNVPIIAIYGLKEAFESTIRTRCIAIGFKESCTQISNHFHPLLNLVKLHGKQYLDVPRTPDEISTLHVLEDMDTGNNSPQKRLKRKIPKASYKSAKVRKTEVVIQLKKKKAISKSC